ncbi:hypothetical protein [Natrarchaeobius oligotrophus]|uniref:Uncharacterized protein n=1 Tax=Natrarchaeobius chitinivorans TaxID=1679083 RepID=A0A3N6MWE9_NATCH|nr:hypothetical protein [Natrarchaeobius chitinivorans]RQH02291.1 hypothetical protein EA472_03045 [Natrarchaeobius chitinivorans]
MSDTTSTFSRRRTLRLSGLIATGSMAALAGCGDEGPGEDGANDDDQLDHPDEAGDSNGGGGGPIDDEDSTGGDPEHDEDEE